MDEQTSPMPAAQQVGERCTGCGKPMAGDQRYCLNCGKRRGKTRVEFEEYLVPSAGGAGEGAPPPGQGDVRPVQPEPPADRRPEREVTPLMAAVGLAGVAAILLMGVLIGRSGGGNGNTQAPQPILASTGIPATSTSSSTTNASTTFTADWPQGQEGYTIELATLSKEGADPAAIDAAKADLVSQGAADVGALDSDEYGSLPPGNYVLYSGVYTTKAEAETALGPLKSSFPDAQVIQVAAQADTGGSGGKKTADADGSDGTLTDGSNADAKGAVKASKDDLEALDDASGAEYEEIQKKLPPTISTPGKAPPKDDKAPGGGGDAVSIG
ncbi:MAG: SPOR domain-containing protein [Solirubrobacterales bacterium]|nr:SPOR domain-containing protein [Solirubrobacterales bacterium]